MSRKLLTVKALKYTYLSDYVTTVFQHLGLKLGHVYKWISSHCIRPC